MRSTDEIQQATKTNEAGLKEHRQKTIWLLGLYSMLSEWRGLAVSAQSNFDGAKHPGVDQRLPNLLHRLTGLLAHKKR